MNEIGIRGAKGNYFNRVERDFSALPNKQESTAPNYHGEVLRLYCLRLTESIVVRFNGGIKDRKTAQESQCSMQFYEAIVFTRKISKAIIDQDIQLDDMVMKDHLGEETEIDL